MVRAIDLDSYRDGVLASSRTTLARAITLVESTHPQHRERASELLSQLTPQSGQAMRVGISGVPGAGKSTLIEALGVHLLDAGHRVAVLAVDPSSNRTGGSILGDKTRMPSLARAENAFVRPSPTLGTLGGVARATRETIVLMEAAGFDVVLVETVGIGQSEITVAGMVDCFLLLSLARAGDQLQGIKKGVLEVADLVAITKADGPHESEARSAARQLRSALRLLASGVAVESAAVSTPEVVTCSALENRGIAELWHKLRARYTQLRDSGELAALRARQQRDWMWALVRETLWAQLRENPRVTALAPELEQRVITGELTPAAAAERILRVFLG